MIAKTLVIRYVHLSVLVALPVLVSARGSGRTISGLSSGPSTTPATLAQIQQQIFTPYCASCHCPGGAGPMSLTDAASSYAALVGVQPRHERFREQPLHRALRLC